MNFFKKCILFCTILSSFFIFGCSKQSSEPISRTDMIIGTVCTIQIFDSKDTSILDKCFDELKNLEDLVSINKTGTELDTVNENAGNKPIKVSDDTFNIVKRGLYYSQLSNGNFDITIGPIVKLWGIGTENAKVPENTLIKDTLSYVGFKNVDLNENDKTIFLKEPNMVIDLGGIAKGYAADILTDLLKEHNVSSAMINLGGNIYMLGNKPNGTDWRIGIQDPNDTKGSVGNLLVKNKSIVTSGTYQRYLEVDGKIYHHILNPKTGYPFDNDLLSVSVISDKSIDGDALSTTTFALGSKKGLEFIESLDNIDAIFITKDKKIFITDGIKNNFKITNSSYSLEE